MSLPLPTGLRVAFAGTPEFAAVALAAMLPHLSPERRADASGKAADALVEGGVQRLGLLRSAAGGGWNGAR